MALTQCIECGKDVSSQATACPHCGCPVTGTAKKSVFQEPPPLASQASALPQASPAVEKTDQEKARKGCLGCFSFAVGGFILLAIIGSFIEEEKKPSDVQLNPLDLANKVGNSPVAQKILSLTRDNAYMTGMTDGANEAKEVSIGGGWTAAEFRLKLSQLRDLKNSFFDLMEATQSKFDSAVFREYKRGWNDGANSVTFQP